jgi:cellulose synthase (UDP-forming)
MTTHLIPSPHRPPSGLRLGLVFVAAVSVLILLAAQPASWHIQIAASVCLIVFMLILSLVWRERPKLRLASIVQMTLIFCALLLWLRYLIWRGTESLPFESGIASAICGAILFIAECYCFIVGALSYIPHLKQIQRTPPPLPTDTSALPDVDVYITTFDEDPDLLKTTIIAATQIRYPTQKLRVYVLDDGGTQQMLEQNNPARATAAMSRAKRIKEIASRYGAHYLARQKNIHAKAGNLNDALRVTTGEFIVVLDCDHIPAEDFIEKTLGFFFEDKQLFLVQTAHNFVTPDPLERNLSTYSQSPGESEMFYHAIMPGLDYWGAAFFCGSAAMLRRCALEDMGGFSTKTVAEDAETTLQAFSKGYTSVYLDKPLVSGLQPDTFSGFIQQRARWAQGMWQIFFFKNPWRLKGLSLMQRVAYTNFALFWGFPMQRLCLMLMPLIALIGSVTLAETSVFDVLSYCLPALAGSLIAGQYLKGRFRWPLISYLYEVIQSAHLVRSQFRLLVNFHSLKFSVTPKAEVLEQDFISTLAKPFYVLLALSITALAMGIIRFINEPAQRDTLLFITFWALLDFIFILCALGVTFERRQRRTEPRPRADGQARLQIGSRVQESLLTDASASGAGIITSNHGDIWLALIHKKLIRLELVDGFSFDAIIQKVTQLSDGRLAIGLQYQLGSITSERAAVATALGSSVQLQKNVQRCQHRKNALTMFFSLFYKAMVLGCGHLFFLLKKLHKPQRQQLSTPRTLWEKKNERLSTPTLDDVGVHSRDGSTDNALGLR